MSAYPNFWAPQQTPNQYQNFQPMQNPYMDRMSQLQQYQQNLQMPQQIPAIQQTVQPIGLVGRPVNDFSEIKADDVPMNGTPAIFIKNDMSEIEVRVWCKDGLIRPTSYKPVLEQSQVETTNTPQMDFNALNEDMKALREDIIARLDRLEQSMTVPTTKAARGKKGEAENE